MTTIKGTILMYISKNSVADCKGNTTLGEVIVEISFPNCIHT
jgi:hypothetical protein